MERLIVDEEGKVTIPQEIIQKRGLRPGDELALVETAEGLLVYQGGVDPKSQQWWDSLNEDERRLAAEEARHYEALTEQERDALWEENEEYTEDGESEAKLHRK
jgi:bifunctional DNA-binding transcriptional regulator/antitoxin component of YhaV-PrlF toxin-antitoxin module